MHTLKSITVNRVFVVLLVVGGFAATAEGRSVYAITDRDSNVSAYDISGVTIEYRASDTDLPHHGSGAVGLALDPESGILFVTYEDSNAIEMLNAKTMLYEENPEAVPGATSRAGIVFDQAKQKLYVVKRQDNRVYVHLWDPASKTLTLGDGTR